MRVRAGSTRMFALLASASAALVATLLALGLAMLLRPADQSDRSIIVVAPSTRTPEPVSSAPPAVVQRMHDTLHDLGTRCAPRKRPTGRDGWQRAIDRDVDVILEFARRYPEGRFPIDDETGAPLSLLLVARDELRSCAPTAAARVDRALPTEFRDRRTAPP